MLAADIQHQSTGLSTQTVTMTLFVLWTHSHDSGIYCPNFAFNFVEASFWQYILVTVPKF